MASQRRGSAIGLLGLVAVLLTIALGPPGVSQTGGIAVRAGPWRDEMG
jgi:hypothetical protein